MDHSSNPSANALTNCASQKDTIVAQATASGRGGIAIIRVSGPRTKDILRAITQSQLIPRQATHLPFCNEAGETLDEGIAIFFPNPNSFTGEDVLELHGHGGPVVVDLLLEQIIKLGARLAEPGEFSLRAFLNGKIDLAQAEAIADLINASSREAARSAMRSLQGEFSQAIYALNEKIIYLRMYVEAAIDFTDEEIDFLSDEKISTTLSVIQNDLQAIRMKAKQGSFLRDGITAVIIGKPNVGKSSLLNALSAKESAIVTAIPGTTRDVLREYISLDGMPMHIADTAGLRESEDVIEQEGIRRAYQEIAKADVVLYVLDASLPSTDDLIAVTKEFAPHHVIFIRNKIDLLNENPSLELKKNFAIVSLSARFGTGLSLLKDHIKSYVGFNNNTEDTYLARRRHLDALERADSHVNDCAKQLAASASLELAAEDLRLAQRALSEIVGEFTADDLLGRIFGSFCIGK